MPFGDLDPLDPFAALAPDEEDPLAWLRKNIPPAWAEPASPAPSPLGTSQPGLGVPAEAVDAAMAQAQQSNSPEMPAAPDAVPGLPSRPAPEPTLGTMQPGIGIPAPTVDAALAAPQMPAQEELDEIEMEGDDASPSSVATMEDAQLAEYKALLEAQREAVGLDRMRAMATEQARQAEEEARIFRESREEAAREAAALDAEAKKLAEERVTPSDWYEEGGIGRTIAAVLAAVAGGLVQHLNGGRNLGLDMVERSIDRYINTKQNDLSRRRQLLADRRQGVRDRVSDAGANLREQAMIRAHAWNSLANEIATEQQAFDPEGTTAVRMEEAKRKSLAHAAKSLLEYEAALAKQIENARKHDLDVRKQLEAERHNREQERTSRTSAAASYLSAKTGARKTDAEIKALEAENTPRPPDYFAAVYGEGMRPPHAMSEKAYRAWLEAKDKGAKVTKEEAEGVIKQAQARLESSGPSGSPYAVADQEGAALRQKDGSIFEVKDGTQRRRVMDIMASAKNVRRIADLVKIMRADKGGASATVGSPEYQELQSLAAQIDFETFVGYGLGAPSEGDKALAEGVRGGKDISSFLYSPEAGFQSYAQGIEEKANTELKNLGYDGEPIKLKSVETAQAMERNILQNLDVYDAPEIEQAADENIRKRAAKRAAEVVPTLAKQAEPDMLKVLAEKNAERLRAGLIDRGEANKAQKAIRKEYRKKLSGPGAIYRDGYERLGPPAAAGDPWEVGAAAAGISVDDYIDRLMGISLQQAEDEREIEE